MAPTLTLKQRLAALSLAPSSPTSPLPSLSPAPSSPRFPPSTAKKALFTPPWARRQNSYESHRDRVSQQDHIDRVRDVMSSVIFQAGVDYETRPMVVMSASALPDPKDISYDVLLSQILAYLDLFVESDYTVVFLAAGGRHTPGWNWVWKAYRSLSRKYRKNLKCLYIVHSSFFSKMLFSLAGAIISPKFFRKITYVDTLSALAFHVPLTQIDIPPAVYHENLKYEDHINLPSPTRANMFGVPLEELMGYDGEKGGLPRVVRDCIHFLRETGLMDEGLFRRSPNSVLLRQAREAYDRGQNVSLHTFGDPHLAAVLLKKFLRDLPEPLFREQLYGVVQRCPLPSKDDQTDLSDITYIRSTLLPELPPCAYILLSHVLHLMHDISLRSSVNLMDANNLAIVLCPNLVKGSNPLRDVMLCAVSENTTTPLTTASLPTPPPEGKCTLGIVIKTCIEHYFEIFDEVPDRTEAVPPSHATTGSLYFSHLSSVDSESAEPLTADEMAVQVRRFSNMVQQDDDSIDDTMLIMPIGPAHPSGGSATRRGTPSSNVRRLQEQLASSANNSSSASGNPPIAYRPRQRAPPVPSRSATQAGTTSSTVTMDSTPMPVPGSSSDTPTVQPPHWQASPNPSRSASSVHTDTAGSGWSAYRDGSIVGVGTLSKAKSLMSMEGGALAGSANGKSQSRSGAGAGVGTMPTVGRGTARKSTGSAVSAVGVTASGFFTPPGDVLPASVPQLPSRSGSGSGGA